MLLVYYKTRAGSFENVKRWMIDVEQYAPGVPVLLVGNKNDLVGQHQVDTDAGADYAGALGAGFIETSAKTDDNVDECFVEIARRCREKAPPHIDAQKHPEVLKSKGVKLNDGANSTMLDFVRNLCPVLASALR